MGRPSKLDDVLLLPDGKGGSNPRVRWEVIVERVKAGVHPEVAAISTGVSSTTFYRWQQWGADRWEDGKLRRARRSYREFREALDRAKAEAETAAVAHVRSAAEKDWRSEAWYLERSRPERWRRRDTIHQAGPADGDAPVPDQRIVHDVDPGAPAKLRELLDLVEGATGDPLGEGLASPTGPGDGGAPIGPDPGSPEPVRPA